MHAESAWSVRTAVAFANSAAGRLVIGVEDRSRAVVGIKAPLDPEERLGCRHLVAQFVLVRGHKFPFTLLKILSKNTQRRE